MIGGGKSGDTIKVLAELDKSMAPWLSFSWLHSADTVFVVGKTLAFTRMSFFNDNGDMFARGSHTK